MVYKTHTHLTEIRILFFILSRVLNLFARADETKRIPVLPSPSSVVENGHEMRTKSTMKTSLQGVLHSYKLIREQQLSCDFLRLPRCRLVAKNVPRLAVFWSKKDTLELVTFTSSDVTGSSLKMFVISPELTVEDIIMRGTSRYKWLLSLEASAGCETSSNFPLFGIANNPKWKKKLTIWYSLSCQASLLENRFLSSFNFSNSLYCSS